MTYETKREDGEGEADVATELATDDEGAGNEVDEDNEVDNFDGDDDVDDGVDDGVDEVDDAGSDDDYSATDSETEVTLVDDGSFALRQMQPLFEVQSFGKRTWVEPLKEELLLPGEPEPEVAEAEKVPLPQPKLDEAALAVMSVAHRSVLDSKLDTPLDRVLVSLSLCASLAVMEWAPQLLHPRSTVHRGRWAAVLLLLVWIPAVH